MPRNAICVLTMLGLLVGIIPVGPAEAAPVVAGKTVAQSAGTGKTVARKTVPRKTVARKTVARRAATASGDLKVTLVARQCSAYTDIMANLARNNIQESLRDLGKDTAYVSGQPVDPAIEGPNDPDCSPLVGWKFQWGRGVGGQVDLLSTVSGALGQTASTQASTPWLDAQGQPTGRTLDGAVTVTLDDQLRQLALSGGLWIQGGTTTDPLLASVFGRGTYGFGALRCSVDNLNGDNVETVAFPSGASHVFCYYYAVTPPPGAGHIVVRKQLEGGGADTYHFVFHGNVSYNPGGAFTVDAAPGSPGQISFARGATGPDDAPWDFAEDVPPGWTLDSLTCDSANNTSTTQIAGTHASVTLAAGDTVTCTYTDKRVFATGLTLFKRTIGGSGGPFAFTVTRPDGGVENLGEATTASPGRPVEVGHVDNAEAGTYTLTETLPADTASGTWESVRVTCIDVHGTTGTGHRTHIRNQFHYRVELAANPVNCLFTNRFHPTHRLRIEKETIGGHGPATFQIRSRTPRGDTHGPQQVTITTSPSHNPAGTTLEDLPAGAYFVTELQTSNPDGRWQLTDIVCDGHHFPVGHATAAVLVNDARPDHTCRFTDTFTPYPHLHVEKLIHDPRGLRTAPVTIRVACSDGQHARLTVRPYRTGLHRLSPALALPIRTTCHVAETASGAAGPIRVRTTHQIGSGPALPGTATQVTLGGTGADVTVRFTDTYYTKSHIKDY